MLGPILQWVNKIYQKVNTNLTAEVDVDVSTRASQSSVDAIPTATIRSIQRGTTNTSTGNTDVSISSVNISKAFVSMSSTAYANDSSAEGMCSVYITSSTEIRIRNSGNTSRDLGDAVAWEVIEFE